LLRVVEIGLDSCPRKLEIADHVGFLLSVDAACSAFYSSER
jgi:hypothetical protein